jgi:hypothetical protein
MLVKIFSSRRTSVASRASDTSLNSQILPAITLDPTRLRARGRDPEAGAGARRKPEFRLPEPGRSIDFGGGGVAAAAGGGGGGLGGILPGDPGYRWN